MDFTPLERETWAELKQGTASAFTAPEKPLLLFFGMRDRTDGVDPLNPSGLRRAGFSGARNMRVNGINIRVPSQYNMPKATDSPFVFDGKRIMDRISGDSWKVELPGVDLKGAGIDCALPTLSGAVGIMVFPGCANFDIGKSCEFCIAGGTAGKTPITPLEAVAALQKIRDFGLPVTSVSLNTGQMPRGDEMSYILSCAEAIKKWDADVKISTEVWPYSVPSDLQPLKGKIDCFQVNIELTSDAARKVLCPAKPDAEAYFGVFERLAKAGFEVTSVLQTNFYIEKEPLEDVARAIRRMLSIGVIPEFLVSRAVTGANVADRFFGRKTTLRENISRYAEWLGRLTALTSEFGQEIAERSGKLCASCVKCGMCSLNAGMKGAGREDELFKNQP